MELRPPHFPPSCLQYDTMSVALEAFLQMEGDTKDARVERSKEPGP